MKPICACACGCGHRARIVADVVFDGIVDVRAPWVDIEHALGAQSSNRRPTIDVVVPAEVLPTIVELAPCWCEVRKFTSLYWCPKHGTETNPHKE